MSDINLESFPSSKNEALAYLYIQSLDLSKKSPAQILDVYEEALDKIRLHYDSKYRLKRMGWTLERNK